MSRRGVSDQILKAPIRRIHVKVKEIKVGTMVITIERVIISKMGITIVIKTLIGITMVTEIIRVGPMFHLKIEKLLLGMVKAVWYKLKVR